MLNGLAGGAGVRTPAGYARLQYLRAAPRTRLARAGEDTQLVLELAGLTERVVVGVEGRPPQLDRPPQDVACRGVDRAYLLRAEGIGLTHGVNAGGEEHLVHVDVAEAGDRRLVEQEPLHRGLSVQGLRQVLGGKVIREWVGAKA